MSNPDNVEQVPPSAPEDTAERSTDFWFGDGSIVLQVQRTLFRVHGGVLSVHSSVFQDMFALPQPTDQPTVDGCVIVSLQDASKDWENLLLWIYHRERLPPDNLPVSVLASVLRLAEKYQLDAIRDNVVAHLQVHIPTNYIEWGEMKPFKRTWVCKKEFDLINLAEEFHLNTILPALYCLAMLLSSDHMEDIFNGQRNNGSVSHLSPAHQSTLVVGISRFRSLILGNICDMRGLISPQCHSPERCPQAITDLLMVYFERLSVADMRFAFGIHHPNMATAHNGIPCCFCCELVERHLNLARVRWWKSLPRLFCGGKNWEELVDFEDR